MDYERTELLWKRAGQFDAWDAKVWATAYGAARQGVWATLVRALDEHPEVGLIVMRSEKSG